MILVDTNIFVRLCRKDDVDRPVARRAITWHGLEDERVVMPQNIYEFWVVATRPIDKNGLGMNSERAFTWLSYIKRTCRILPDPPGIFEQWEHLVRTYKTLGKSAHDARLVAAMQLYGVQSILTFNSDDFIRYGVSIIDPRSLPAV